MKALHAMDPSQAHAFVHISTVVFQCLCSTLGYVQPTTYRADSRVSGSVRSLENTLPDGAVGRVDFQ